MQLSLAISAIAALATASPLATRQDENVDVLTIASPAPEEFNVVAGPPITVQFANLRFYQDINFRGTVVTFSGPSMCSSIS